MTTADPWIEYLADALGVSYQRAEEIRPDTPEEFSRRIRAAIDDMASYHDEPDP